ncbi:MAG: TetR/AcrR family transcriptional regulator [Chloroflexota bacterium]
MPATPRERIISTACQLLERQGFHASGLNQIVEESGAPKGSLYHYFPGGKTEIVIQAVAQAAVQTVQRIEHHLSAQRDAAAGARSLVEAIADQVEQSGFRAGGPLMTVALETVHASPAINQACRQAYQWLQDTFARRLQQAGVNAARARSLALFIVAVIEGAVLLSRTQHSGEALRQAGVYLEQVIRTELN